MNVLIYLYRCSELVYDKAAHLRIKIRTGGTVVTDCVREYVENRGVNNGRIVLHSDLNNFFASVECKKNPELWDVPVAVCGNREDRHGIVLAKNEKAKKAGVKTAEAIWQAKQKCPHLVIVPPDYDEYVRYSAIVKEIYARYTDRVEPFGMDEAWLELTGDIKIKTLSDGERIAQEIRRTVKSETGLTVSVGVSDNKVFSKLASDYKKPDAVTVFGPFNYESIVSKLDIGDMLFVGRSSKSKLHVYGINTIGDMSSSNEIFMKTVMGKNGLKMYYDACGANTSPVTKIGESAVETKSVGNSVTLPRDLENLDEVSRVIHLLSDKVAWRLRNGGFACKTVCISVRNTGLITTEKQCPVVRTSNSIEIAHAAIKLFCENYNTGEPVRSMGVRCTGLVNIKDHVQLDMFDETRIFRNRREEVDKVVDKIRMKYGMKLIYPAAAMGTNTTLANHPAFSHGV